ncbi:hypothetical protein [Solimonas flava]|uniref:hypothetical protein n=1 Tax=Solimonas flava TaxID=415849 RepID=UPI0012B6030C|nr:hypothetical protein [Solimonas flava]
MDVGASFLGGVVAVAAAAYFAGRHHSRQKWMRGREPMAADQILRGLPEGVSQDEASEVLQVVGKCFGIRPEILRLEDSISALQAMDSWALGKGQEDLEAWLRSRGVKSLRTKGNTIRDLILSTTKG